MAAQQTRVTASKKLSASPTEGHIFNLEEEEPIVQQPLVIPGRALAIDGGVIELQATTWSPKNLTNDAGGEGPAVNLLMSHACGFCKDTLMPLASELAERVPAVRRGSAVAFDYRGHGQSGPLLKETFETFAKEPALIWNFPAEDVKAVCNSGLLQRVGSSQPQPPLLVGVGHSMGGNGLVKALLDYTKDEVPLDALVVFEPILNLQSDAEYTGVGPAVGEGMVAGARKRKNEFPSRLEAKEKFGQKPPYGLWDKRALDGFCKTGLRPKDLYNAEAGAGVPFPGRTWAVPTNNRKLSASPTEGHVFNLSTSDQEPATASDEGPMVLSCHPEFEAVMYSSTQKPLTSRLPQLTQEKKLPILVITGTESQMFEPPRREAYGLPAEGPANFGEEFRRRLLPDGDAAFGYNGVDVVQMQGLSHLGPMERPAAVAEVVAKWMEDRVIQAQGAGSKARPSALARL